MHHDITKKVAQQWHAKMRAAERFGINLNKQKRFELIRKIQSARSTLLYRQSLRVSVFRETIDGQEVDIVYDRKRHTIITFLCPEPKEIYFLIASGLNRKEAQDKYYETLKRNQEAQERATDNRDIPTPPPPTTPANKPQPKV